MKAVLIGAKISLGGTKQTQNNFDTFDCNMGQMKIFMKIIMNKHFFKK